MAARPGAPDRPRSPQTDRTPPARPAARQLPGRHAALTDSTLSSTFSLGPGRGVVHQSAPRISPPLGVQAAHQVVPLTLADRVRTDPSARPTIRPERCGPEARLGSQPPRKGDGRSWKCERGPVL